MTEQYQSVGKLGKPHGLSGAFRFYFEHPLKNNNKLPLHFMLSVNGTFMPWFISKLVFNDKQNGFIEFEHIQSPEKAKPFATYQLYLTTKEAGLFFKSTDDESPDLTGYIAFDESGMKIGIITEMIETPAQYLCVVKKETGEAMIPLVDDFIEAIDKRKKEIVFNLPEGLLDL